jgi:hypothetical protein
VIQLGLEPDRALRNCPVGNFSEGDSLPRWRVRDQKAKKQPFGC